MDADPGRIRPGVLAPRPLRIPTGLPAAIALGVSVWVHLPPSCGYRQRADSFFCGRRDNVCASSASKHCCCLHGRPPRELVSNPTICIVRAITPPNDFGSAYPTGSMSVNTHFGGFSFRHAIVSTENRIYLSASSPGPQSLYSFVFHTINGILPFCPRSCKVPRALLVKKFWVMLAAIGKSYP